MGILTHLTEIYAIAEKKERLNVSSMQVWLNKTYYITPAKLERHEYSIKSNGGMQLERYLVVCWRYKQMLCSLKTKKQMKSKSIFK